MKNNQIMRIGITQGDINGIGYEVILKVLSDERILELFTPVIYGSTKIALQYLKALNLQPIRFNQIHHASEARDGMVNIVNVTPESVTPQPGIPSAEAGRAAFDALAAAVADVKAGVTDAIVTAPINKNSIQSADFNFPGHTEYLESNLDSRALMILFNSEMRVALVTTHLPVAEIASHITREGIVEKLTLLNNSLKRDFAINSPRIAVLALNPHAGDGGLLGDQEETIIAPAIADANAHHIMAFGPYAADGFFGAGLYKRFDAVLAMYHDQGLAPLKALDMDAGVNFTAGLTIVRTSPDHGTGFDIAGRGEASEQSMREAIYSAIDIVRARESYDTASAHPLRRQYFDKSKDNVVLDLSGD